MVEVGLRGDAFGRYGVRLLVGGAVLVGAGLVEAGSVGARARHSDRGSRDSARRPAGSRCGPWATHLRLDPFAARDARVPPGATVRAGLDQA